MKKSRIKKYIETYKYNGLAALFNRILGKLKIKYRIQTQIERKKKFFLEKVLKISNKIVMEGPYSGVKFDVESHWNNYDFSSKLIGIYERAVQEKIIELKNTYQLENLINIGAGEGYHLVSLIKKNYFKTATAYEIDKNGQQYLKNNLKLNEIKSEIKIFGKGDFESIKNVLDNTVSKKTLFLIDIEGDEYTLLNYSFLEYFKNCFFIIELHENIINEKYKNIIDEFHENIKKFYNINKIENDKLNPFKIKDLDFVDDDTRLLGVSEQRPSKMDWLVLKPKNIN